VGRALVGQVVTGAAGSRVVGRVAASAAGLQVAEVVS